MAYSSYSRQFLDFESARVYNKSSPKGRDVNDFLTSFDREFIRFILWYEAANTHLAFTRGYIKRRLVWDFLCNRDVAQLVARTAGGGEAAGSSPVIPTRWYTYSK